MKILSLRPCDDCGTPDLRDVRKKRCAPCDRKAAVEQTMKYRRSPRGRAKYAASHREPKWKSYRAEWADRNKDRLKVYYRRRYKPLSGRVIACVMAEFGCGGTFVRTLHNGRQIYGDDCTCRRENKEYLNALARARGRRERLAKAA